MQSPLYGGVIWPSDVSRRRRDILHRSNAECSLRKTVGSPAKVPGQSRRYHGRSEHARTAANCPAGLVWRTPLALVADQDATEISSPSAYLRGHGAIYVPLPSATLAGMADVLEATSCVVSYSAPIRPAINSAAHMADFTSASTPSPTSASGLPFPYCRRSTLKWAACVPSPQTWTVSRKPSASVHSSRLGPLCHADTAPAGGVKFRCCFRVQALQPTFARVPSDPSDGVGDRQDGRRHQNGPDEAAALGPGTRRWLGRLLARNRPAEAPRNPQGSLNCERQIKRRLSRRLPC